MPLHTSHLTTGQFSASLDQQLSAPEQSTCQTHLNTCTSCQQQLTELQQTVLLVRALPRAPLPRSFMLPAEALAGEKADAPPNLVGQAHNRIIVFPSYIHSTMHIASTLVAALGLFFILSGVLTIALPLASTPFVINVKVKAPSSSSSDSKYLSSTSGSAPHAPPITGDSAPLASFPHIPVATGKSALPSTGGSANTHQPSSSPNTSQQQPPLSLIRPFFNADTSQGHLGIGLLLFIVGMVGAIHYSLSSRKKHDKDDHCNR